MVLILVMTAIRVGGAAPTSVELVDAKQAEALLRVADAHDARVIVVGSWARRRTSYGTCRRVPCCASRPRTEPRATDTATTDTNR